MDILTILNPLEAAGAAMGRFIAEEADEKLTAVRQAAIVARADAAVAEASLQIVRANMAPDPKAAVQGAVDMIRKSRAELVQAVAHAALPVPNALLSEIDQHLADALAAAGEFLGNVAKGFALVELAQLVLGTVALIVVAPIVLKKVVK